MQPFVLEARRPCCRSGCRYCRGPAVGTAPHARSSRSLSSDKGSGVLQVLLNMLRKCLALMFIYSSTHRLHCGRTKTSWHESASELYRQSDRRLSAKSVLTFEDRGCHVVRATDLYGRILGFLDRSSCFSFQVALQLYSRVSVDPVPDTLLLRKSGSAGNRTRDL
jgi:hypothetical protein